MTLFEQFEQFDQEMRSRILRVLLTNDKSFTKLRADFYNFNEYMDVSYSVDCNGIYVNYTYLDPVGDLQTERVWLPELFVENFEEFMRSQK